MLPFSSLTAKTILVGTVEWQPDLGTNLVGLGDSPRDDRLDVGRGHTRCRRAASPASRRVRLGRGAACPWLNRPEYWCRRWDRPRPSVRAECEHAVRPLQAAAAEQVERDAGQVDSAERLA